MIEEYYGNKTIDDYEDPITPYPEELRTLLPRVSRVDGKDLNIIDDIEKYIRTYIPGLGLTPTMVIRLSTDRARRMLGDGYLRPIFFPSDITTYGSDTINDALQLQRNMELGAVNNKALAYAHILASNRSRFIEFVRSSDGFMNAYNQLNQ